MFLSCLTSGLILDDEKAKQTSEYVDFWFVECVKGSLADNCVQYYTGRKDCRRLTKYKKACPQAKPSRKSLMVDGQIH
jgi:hypothetical protein